MGAVVPPAFRHQRTGPSGDRRYIDRYNNRRRHSSCEMMSPVAYEQVLADREARQADPAKAA